MPETRSLTDVLRSRRSAFTAAAATERKLAAKRATMGRAARTYAGARVGASTMDWVTAVLSADQAIKRDLRRLRDRSRALVRDFSYASRFVQSVAENVAGPHGVTMQVRAMLADGKTFDDALNAEVEAGWTEWCEDPTVEGIGSLADVEHLLCESLPQDGAFLVRMITGYTGNRFRFALQLLDADQIDEKLEIAPGEGHAEVRQGVEVDGFGRPVAYWLWTQHPSEYGRGLRQRVRVPADEIVHGFIRRRAGQTHGVPWFAAVLIDERMLQGFQEAAITAARVGATNAFFLEADPNVIDADDSDDASTIDLELEPGSGRILPPGYKLSGWNPDYPNAEFDPFTRAVLQSMAVGSRVSHMTFTGDLRGANYSSMRAGLLPERDAWRLLHGWFTRSFHRRVYGAWLRASVLAGAINVAPRDLDRVRRAVRWMPRGFPWVDPAGELDAAQKEVAMGINTLTRLAAERGRDIEDLFKERAREIELAKKLGVPLGVDRYVETFGAQAPPNKNPGGSHEDEEGTAEGDSAAAPDGADRAGLIRLARGI